MRILSDDGVTALYAALVRQAVEDYRMGFHSSIHPDAAAFLRSAGLLTDAGLDRRLITPRSVTGRPSHRKQVA